VEVDLEVQQVQVALKHGLCVHLYLLWQDVGGAAFLVGYYRVVADEIAATFSV
jgi:hypothetical protein